MKAIKVILIIFAFVVSTITLAAPAIPLLSNPANGDKKVKLTTKFTWSSSGVGVYYRIVVSQNSSFSGFNESTLQCDSTCGTTTLSGTSHTRTLSLAGKNYYWKVRAYTSTGTSSWSETRAFSTLCEGDFRASNNNCFNGISFNTSSLFNWQYVTGSGFLNNSAWITTHADNGYSTDPSPAEWKFTTVESGQVWFSAYIPPTNATARIVTYIMSCRHSTVYDYYGYPYFDQALKTIDQLNYSGWVTLAHFSGDTPAGASCKVTASKYEDVLNGSSSTSKMAIDGMKITVY